MHDVNVEVNPSRFCGGSHSHCVQDACQVYEQVSQEPDGD